MARRYSGLALAAAALLLAGPSTGADLRDAQARGTLRVLIYDRSDEFFSVTPGAPPGFDHEVLQGFARLHRLRLKVVPLPSWDALIPALLDGEGDVIAGRFTVTPKRSELVAFTAEVFPTRSVVVTRRPHRVVRSLAELRAEKVGTIKGTSMAEAVAAAGVPASHVDDSIPWGTLPQALAEGKITAAVLGIEAVLVAQRKDPDLEIGLALGPPGALAYAVRKDDPQLLAALNDYILNLRRTQSWDRLVVKYLGQAAPEILKKTRAQ